MTVCQTETDTEAPRYDRSSAETVFPGMRGRSLLPRRRSDYQCAGQGVRFARGAVIASETEAVDEAPPEGFQERTLSNAGRTPWTRCCLRRRQAEIFGSIPNKWGTQVLRLVLQSEDEPALTTVNAELGRETAEAVVIPGREAVGEFMGSETLDTKIETPWETFEEQIVVALAGGLALERQLPAELIDVARSCGMRELRTRDERGGVAVSTGPG